MESTGYLDWLASAEDALHQLASQRKGVFVTGLSMGGTITLNLAARFPDIVSGALAELLMSRAAPKRIPGIGSDIKARKLGYAFWHHPD